MSLKLHQVIAIEKDVKKRAKENLVQVQTAIQRPQIFEGFTKTYVPRDEEGERQPPQTQRVQFTADQILAVIQQEMGKVFDTVAQKDIANTNAVADVVVEGETLLSQVPATYLLFIEKQLGELQGVLSKMPVLDASTEWTYDDNTQLHRSVVQTTIRTRKVQKPIVLYDATERHPAQTQLITEDESVGEWNTIRFSGAVAESRKRELFNRLGLLIEAVKVAREQANQVDTARFNQGEKVFEWLFK